MAGVSQRTQLLLLLSVGTLFLAISFAGANPSGGCGNACNCPNEQSCTHGAAKNKCCWTGTKCIKVDFLTDRANCGKCNSPCSYSGSCCQGRCCSPNTDPSNCGSCGKRCGTGQTCCSGNCVGLRSDNSNCGICGKVCGSGQSCCGGVCKDSKSFDTDSNNCGRCGSVCSGYGNTCCCGVCKDWSSAFASDPKNCGRCGKVCGSGESCKEGHCVVVPY